MVKSLEAVLVMPIIAGVIPMAIGAYQLSQIVPEERTIGHAAPFLLYSIGAFATTLALRETYRKIKEKYFSNKAQ